MKLRPDRYEEVDALDELNSDRWTYQRISDAQKPKQSDFWKVTIGSIIGAILAIALFGGCTVAPKPVEAQVIAFDANTQNAGVIDCDKSGCLVTPGWIGRYRALEKVFNTSAPGDALIKIEGNNYRVPFEVSNKYAEMREAARGV